MTLQAEDSEEAIPEVIDEDTSDDEPGDEEAGVFAPDSALFVCTSISRAVSGFRPAVLCEGYMATLSAGSQGFSLTRTGSDQHLSFKYEPPSPKFARKRPGSVSYRLQLLHGSQFLYSLRGLPRVVRCQRAARALEWGPVHVVFCAAKDMDTLLATIRYVDVEEVGPWGQAVAAAALSPAASPPTSNSASAAASPAQPSRPSTSGSPAPSPGSHQGADGASPSPARPRAVSGTGAGGTEAEGGALRPQGSARKPLGAGLSGEAGSGLMWRLDAAALWLDGGAAAAGADRALPERPAGATVEAASMQPDHKSPASSKPAADATTPVPGGSQQPSGSGQPLRWGQWQPSPLVLLAAAGVAVAAAVTAARFVVVARSGSGWTLRWR
ncbi:hypothetical protein HYH03_012091 [Edaphochlamys debaryana]|uniref:Uncharacterized protein n=1 Tax=Edaphochlamys debaryana TaxID=47281 RepID=A0A835XYY2_9CHLO|nr:hypothetical protein HYH03_012091 [Edaphochlamys debaryana]|eukprot:KAG2489455.1 hypothetical protein HYH03_012091 [Edaphochlamys debaryana]